MPKSDQGKNWCFTVNTYKPEDVEVFNNLECEAIVVGHEVGELGREHLQGFIRFHSNMRFSAVKKIHETAHWELCKGSFSQNVKYCRKEGHVLVEKGCEDVGKSVREEYADALSLARNGDTDKIMPMLYTKHYWVYEKIKRERDLDCETLQELDNWWFYGASGTGKSRTARELYPRAYIKNLNKWWCGYKGEDTVIIEEFKPDTKLESFMKIWADRYAFRAEIKGASMMIRPKRIIVCSNYRIDECFSGVDVEPIKRRFKVRTFN